MEDVWRTMSREIIDVVLASQTIVVQMNRVAAILDGVLQQVIREEHPTHGVILVCLVTVNALSPLFVLELDSRIPSLPNRQQRVLTSVFRVVVTSTFFNVKELMVSLGDILCLQESLIAMLSSVRRRLPTIAHGTFIDNRLIQF
jgi:hypothetical protein